MLLAMASSGAFAADMPVRVAPPPPVYNWNGFYIGGNFGGVWDNGTLTDNFTGASFSGGSLSRFIGGGQIGYNWQVSPQFVLGVEWMFDGTSPNNTTNTVTVAGPNFGPTVIQGSTTTNWVTTVAARFGYAANSWLFYGKAGGGWVHDSATVTDINDGISVSASNTTGGWLAGAGIEYGFTPNWTMKIEYDHLGLSDVTRSGFTTVFPSDSVTLSRRLNMVTVGVNYKF